MAEHNEIRVLARGGLGNQLFQYGAALNLSNKLQLPITIDDLFLSRSTPNKFVGYRVLELDSFANNANFVFRENDLKNKLISKMLEKQRLLGDHFPTLQTKYGYFANERIDQFDSFQKLNKAIVLNSYCGSPSYFGNSNMQLVNEITKVIEPSNWFLETLEKINSVSPNAIHVRLGDYSKFKSTYGEPDAEYFGSAINFLNKLGAAGPNWLFSDEPEKAMGLLGNKINFDFVVTSPSNSRPIETLNLLGSCRNIICSNSSFSWWGGYLATAKSEFTNVIFPRPMFNDPKIPEPFNWLPPGWVSLGRRL